MQITRATDAALRVLMVLAGDPERQVTVRALADELSVPRHHLAKVVQSLAREGWVATARGRVRRSADHRRRVRRSPSAPWCGRSTASPRSSTASTRRAPWSRPAAGCRARWAMRNGPSSPPWTSRRSATWPDPLTRGLPAVSRCILTSSRTGTGPEAARLIASTSGARTLAPTDACEDVWGAGRGPADKVESGLQDRSGSRDGRYSGERTGCSGEQACARGCGAPTQDYVRGVDGRPGSSCLGGGARSHAADHCRRAPPRNAGPR